MSRIVWHKANAIISPVNAKPFQQPVNSYSNKNAGKVHRSSLICKKKKTIPNHGMASFYILLLTQTITEFAF